MHPRISTINIMSNHMIAISVTITINVNDNIISLAKVSVSLLLLEFDAWQGAAPRAAGPASSASHQGCGCSGPGRLRSDIQSKETADIHKHTTINQTNDNKQQRGCGATKAVVCFYWLYVWLYVCVCLPSLCIVYAGQCTPTTDKRDHGNERNRYESQEHKCI